MAMVFKLAGDGHAKALAQKGAHLFDPMGGRPMKEWVQLPPTVASRWEETALDALEYVRAAPVKKKAPKAKPAAKKTSVVAKKKK